MPSRTPRASGEQRRNSVAGIFLRPLTHSEQELLRTELEPRPMLELADLRVSYGHLQAVQGVSLEVPDGQLRVVIGPNGAGKTTLLRAVMGLLVPSGGRVGLAGVDVTGRSADSMARQGVAMVAEGRAMLTRLTVEENLEMGGYVLRDRRRVARNIDRALELFPRLAERRRQLAGTLSGGEQQMLAIARALISEPRLLLVDEPSLGLAPLIVRQVFEILREINREGTTILLVEQNAHRAVEIAEWVYVLEAGAIAHSGPPADAALHEQITRSYLGAASSPLRPGVSP